MGTGVRHIQELSRRRHLLHHKIKNIALGTQIIDIFKLFESSTVYGEIVINLPYALPALLPGKPEQQSATSERMGFH